MLKKTALTLVALVAISGCAKRVSEMSISEPPTADQVVLYRANFLKVSPSAKVGVVDTVRAGDMLVMIVDIPTEGLKADDVISFVGGDESTVAYGKIVQVLDGKVAASYTPGQRAPLVGDVAVKF